MLKGANVDGIVVRVLPHSFLFPWETLKSYHFVDVKDQHLPHGCGKKEVQIPFFCGTFFVQLMLAWVIDQEVCRNISCRNSLIQWSTIILVIRAQSSVYQNIYKTYNTLY